MRTTASTVSIILLATAAVMKLRSVHADTVAVAADTAGLVLASVVLVGSASLRRYASMLMSGLFLGFFLVGLRQHLHGENCGCFGAVTIDPRILFSLNLALCSAFAFVCLRAYGPGLRDDSFSDLPAVACSRPDSWLAAMLPLLGILASGVTMASVHAWMPTGGQRSGRGWYDFETYAGRRLPIARCVSEDELSKNFSGVLLLTRRGCESCDRLHESGELPRLVDSMRTSPSDASPALVRLDADDIAACLLVETPAILQLREGRLWRDLDADEISNQIENYKPVENKK